MKIAELKRKIREDLERISRDKSIMENIMRNHQQNQRPAAKSVQHAELAKARGNKLYEQAVSDVDTEFKILHLYNESIAFAPLQSAELATAYSNKSALLRRMLKFKHCITEADKALAITQSNSLKIKLLCRKAECLVGFHSSESKSCLEEARTLLTNLEDTEKTKKTLGKMINRAQFFIDNPNSGNFREGEISGKIFDSAETQAVTVIQEAEETTNIQNSFKIEYTKKYGHHLVAARDFEPGEIMCVETPYHNQILDWKTPSYCCHCTNYLWTIVACDHCSWYVYCSERCKVEAWNDHHAIGCHALQDSKELIPLRETVDYSPDSIFFKALKETGSISQLQAELESMDKCEDHSSQDLISDGKFMSYKTLCLASIRKFAKKEFDACVRCASFGLIGLAKPILKVTHDPLNLKKLMRDETALFVGALLCKLRMVSSTRTKSAKLRVPFPDESNNMATVRTVVMTAILTPISCVPNIGHCPTFNNKFFMYATEPIKAGSQIFSPQALSSIYNNVPKAQRQFFHTREYQVSCNCRACADDWDEIIKNPPQASDISDAKFALLREITAEMFSIRRQMEDHPFYDVQLVDDQLIERMRKLVVRTWKHFPMPSQITFEAVKFMIEVYQIFFPRPSRR